MQQISLKIGNTLFSLQENKQSNSKFYILETAYGQIKGRSVDGVIEFRGVPFAQPPVGDLRFKSPRSLQNWSGIYDATYNRGASYQFSSSTKEAVLKELKEIDPGVPGIMAWPAYVDKTYDQPEVSEDCLYLTIWIPEKSYEKSLPVYIYYHGGANAVSAGSFDLERGNRLAKEENVIVVRPNYRMGALGWLHLGLVSDIFCEAVNLGVQDQMAALKWTAENIASFGGNQDNIVIGGESAGATAVSHLLTNPDSRKYAQRAVIQSLTPFNPWSTQQKEEAKFVVEMYLKLLNITDIATLQKIHPDKLLAVQSVLTRFFEADKHVAWRPLGAVVDGNIVPENPSVYLSTAKPEFKPGFELMLGFAKDEWQFFRGHSDTIRHGDKKAALHVLEQVYGDKALQLFDTYQRISPSHKTPGHILSDIMSFEFFKYAELAIANNLSAQQIPVYVYQFSYDLPGWNAELRAVHTGNIPFLFRNYTPEDLQLWPSFDGIDRENMVESATRMGERYASFIRNNGLDGRWDKYNADTASILWFGKEVENRSNLLTAEWKAFEAVGVREARDLENLLVSNVREAIKTYQQNEQHEN